MSVASPPSPALPHAELEGGEIGGAQEPACRHHHVGGGECIVRNRCELLAGLAARRIEPARGGDQRLQGLGGKYVELAVGDAALDRGADALGVGDGDLGARLLCRYCGPRAARRFSGARLSRASRGVSKSNGCTARGMIV